jgi:peptide/nickel transport system permease protein
MIVQINERKKKSLPGGLVLVWKRSPSLVIGLVMVSFLVIIAIFGDKLAPYDPIKQDFKSMLKPPSSEHIMGTDKFGRDAFSRVLVGTKIDLQIGIIATILPLFIGLIIGSTAAYYGGMTDMLLMRILDIFMAFPFYVLVITIMAILGPGMSNMYIALSLTNWIGFARIIRGEIIIAKNMDYVMAARALSLSDFRIITRHLLPNTITPIIIYSMTVVVISILAGSSLGFLGLGVQPPLAEWGVMVASGREYVTVAPWLPIFPGLAIAVMGIAFSLVGDGAAILLRHRNR